MVTAAADAQLLAQSDGSTGFTADKTSVVDDDTRTIDDDELRKMLTGIIIDNARLRKQVNFVIRYALKIDISSEKDDEATPSIPTVQNKFPET
ncbi:unnamed protein product [Ilex paraguariensis]|uniref:Uncharacterized protein n=1 Tax=Ilex paraguariensis TaxID=185542 RepID=A0ABC8SFL4_9AQUA